MTKQSIEQLQQSINTLQKQLDAFAATQQTQKLEMWKPHHNQAYFYINDMDVEATDSCSGNGDGILYKTGNCFPTEELATYYSKRRAARQRLEMLALAENGMVPYEFRMHEDNWCIENQLSQLEPSVHDGYRAECQHFPTQEAAQRVLAAMTDDDLMLLYGTANKGGK